MASIRADLIALLGARGIGILIPLLATPYLARVLNPEGFGLFSLGLAIYAAITTVVKFGFEMSSLREGAIARVNPQDFRSVLCDTWTAQLALWVIVAVLLLGSWPWLVGDGLTGGDVLVTATLGALFSALYPQWALQALGDYRASSFISIGSRLIMLILTFVVVRGPEDYALALLLQVGWVLPAAFAAFAVMRRRLQGKVFTKVTARSVLSRSRSSFPFFLSVLFGSVYTTMNVIFLGWFGASAAGIGNFAASQQIITAARIPADPMKQVYYPRMAAAKDTSEQAFSHLKRTYGVGLCGLYALIGIVLFFTADYVVRIYLGPGYEDAILMVKYCAISLVPWAIAMWAESTLQASGLVRKSLFGPMIGAMAHLLLVWPCIVYWDALGVAIALVGTQTVITVVLLIQIWRQRTRS